MAKKLKNHIAMPDPSPDLVARIMSDAEAELGDVPLRMILWPFDRMWRPALVLSASVLLGVWVGFAELAEDQVYIDAEIEELFWG